MKWFKFYGQDYLSDPKMLSLSASERSCWITLLCYSSVNDNGMITFLSEEQLMIQAGLDFQNDEWDRVRGIVEKLVKLQMIQNDNGMITVLNWKKRQETSLTSYERVKRWREKKRVDNEKITLEENRIEEKRDDTSMNYLKEIPLKDMEEFIVRFDCSEKGVKSKAESLFLYCKSKGKRYKNYKAFLLNALKRDFPERKIKVEDKVKKEVSISPDQKKKIEEEKELIRKKMQLT